jgi:hypothetical protein
MGSTWHPPLPKRDESVTENPRKIPKNQNLLCAVLAEKTALHNCSKDRLKGSFKTDFLFLYYMQRF